VSKRILYIDCGFRVDKCHYNSFAALPNAATKL